MGNACHSARAAGAVLAAILTASPAIAETCPAPHELAPQEGTRAFTVERRLAGMAQPIESAGEVTAGEERLIWHICRPFDIRTEIGPEGVFQAYEGGPLEPAGPQAAQEMVRRLGITDLLRGRFDSLSESFEVEQVPGDGDGNWRVELVPLDAKLDRVIGGIVVEGCTRIERIVMTRPDGDREEILFGAMLPQDPERAACAAPE